MYPWETWNLNEIQPKVGEWNVLEADFDSYPTSYFYLFLSFHYHHFLTLLNSYINVNQNFDFTVVIYGTNRITKVLQIYSSGVVYNNNDRPISIAAFANLLHDYDSNKLLTDVHVQSKFKINKT